MDSKYYHIKFRQGIVKEAVYKKDPDSKRILPEAVNSIYLHTDLDIPICRICNLIPTLGYTYKDLIKEYISFKKDAAGMLLLINPMEYGAKQHGSIEDLQNVCANNQKDLFSLKFSNIIWSTDMGNTMSKITTHNIYRNKEGIKIIKDCIKNGLIYQEIKK